MPVIHDFVVDSDRVELPPTFVGRPSSGTVGVRSLGRGSFDLAFAVAQPFGVDPGPTELAGASSLAVPVTFQPDAVGSYEKRLRISGHGKTLEVTLVGKALPPPNCSPRGPCWTARFDLASGQCVEETLPDSTPCTATSVCLESAQCAGGECVGAAKDCDDHDQCTTDACDATLGCVHFSATARCGDVSNPCLIPYCDPVVGCAFTEADDGTSCGSANCSSAHICLSGFCRLVPVTDGAACGNDSPCQGRGHCQANVCVRPPATDLVAAWTTWAGGNRSVQWDSIADPLGNVYWRERDLNTSGAYLVSVTIGGQPRYAVPILPGDQMALVESLLLVRSGATLQSYATLDGSPVWGHYFPPSLSTGPNAVGEVHLTSLSRGPPGTVYVGIREMGRADPSRVVDSGLALVELATGAVLWQKLFADLMIDSETCPVDESGYIYVGFYTNTGGRRYAALTPTGQVRWNIDNPHANPAAVFGGRVYHWDHWLSETATGAWVNTEPPLLQVAGYPRLALGAISYVGTQVGKVPSCSEPGSLVDGTMLHLVRVEPTASQLKWTLPIAGADAGGLTMTNTVLTSRNTIVFSQTEDYCNTSGRHVLREISALGEPVFSCRLPAPEAYLGEGLLVGGKWIASIYDSNLQRYGVRAFDLPGTELPEHGWATAWGSPARDGHAR